MTKETEALKLALEALKTIDEAMPFPVAKLAQAAIKEALAQPECTRCKDLEEHAYDLLGQLKVANLKWSVAHPWVGLTDKEMWEAVRPLCDHDQIATVLVGVSEDEYRAIEAKLKEKNT